MTTYVILLPGDEAAWEAAGAEERAATYARHDAFGAALAARGHRVVGGAELAHSREARVVHWSPDGLSVTEGPYAETAEQLTGFYLVESDDLDDLLQCVGVLEDPAVEVRATLPAPEAS